ncbi:hypothetical protein FOXB_01273 [Fusarium oxysporum f. sp. conglutinans Fo5176]|uniref:Uncharacterized protein n=3 Tax=Fusarium oxysporum TaxID=5507 RepID=F9F4E8_FUSOF|nr:hypothetical protein FOXB_01273 [Fusarium oxysporum f. sp. conglutinans Fo5176]
MTAENAYISRRLAGHRLQTLVARYLPRQKARKHPWASDGSPLSICYLSSSIGSSSDISSFPPYISTPPYSITHSGTPDFLNSLSYPRTSLHSLLPTYLVQLSSSPACNCQILHRKARASSVLLKKEVWRLKGQGGPYRPVSPDMFESNDYLRFDLEHPRQAAFVRVSVEDNLAKTGTAFKFACVEFRDSTSAKKYVANIKLKRS